MALDCYTYMMLANELKDKLTGGRIDKVYQMSRVQLLLTVRSLGDNYRLYISSDASKGRVCLTNMKFENPDTPPMFCMLMRKHLSGGKITDIQSVKNERIIKICVENTNELFEPVKKTLIVEMMGKYSNIILVNEENRIIDCVTHVDFTVSEKRQILPGLYYEEPPAPEKKDPFLTDYSDMLKLFSDAKDEKSVEALLLDNFAGMSPLLARELEYRGNGDYISTCVEYGKILKALEQGETTPVVLLEKSTGKPKNVSFTDIMQYGDYYEKKYFGSVNEAVDFFYGSQEQIRKLDEKKADLNSVVAHQIKKASKKLDIHLKNVEKAKNKDKYRIYAELITANLYKLTKNAKIAEVENYYDENRLIKIPMDETISPAKNSKKYFEKYNKEKNMEKISKKMAEELEKELLYLKEVGDTIYICDDLKSLAEIKTELIEEGYIEEKRNGKQKKSDKKPPLSAPNKFLSSDGFTFFAGKNNKQNEKLTLKDSQKSDLWFHIRNAAGSHVVIKTDGREASDTAIFEAATVAAYYSKRASDGKADIDYTLVKYVKKPAGAKTGMVIYENFKSITVKPDIDIVEKLRVK